MIERLVDKANLSLGDAFEGMAQLADASFDVAIVDPPYGASTKATWALPEDHSLDRFGGAWKLAAHEWDKIEGLQSFTMTVAWMREIARLVKPSGSFWVHATYHNAGFVNVACQMLGLEIINEVIWFKRNAFPNLSGRRLTASHETIYWVHTGGSKRQYRFNYDVVKEACFSEDKLKEGGKQLRTVWDIPNNKSRDEIKYGAHPTQKPLRVSQRLLMISGCPDGNLLIPFLGSGSEAVAGLRYGMIPTGFEINEGYFDIARQRVYDEVNKETVVQERLVP